MRGGAFALALTCLTRPKGRTALRAGTKATFCSQSQFGHCCHLPGMGHGAGRGCFVVVRGCLLRTVEGCCEWHASGTAGDGDPDRGWRYWAGHDRGSPPFVSEPLPAVWPQFIRRSLGETGRRCEDHAIVRSRRHPLLAAALAGFLLAAGCVSVVRDPARPSAAPAPASRRLLNGRGSVNAVGCVDPVVRAAGFGGADC
jgi:hypothetical protein